MYVVTLWALGPTSSDFAVLNSLRSIYIYYEYYYGYCYSSYRRYFLFIFYSLSNINTTRKMGRSGIELDFFYKRPLFYSLSVSLPHKDHIEMYIYFYFLRVSFS